MSLKWDTSLKLCIAWVLLVQCCAVPLGYTASRLDSKPKQFASGISAAYADRMLKNEADRDAEAMRSVLGVYAYERFISKFPTPAAVSTVVNVLRQAPDFAPRFVEASTKGACSAVQALCDPCFKFPGGSSSPFCTGAKKMCLASICNPLCLRMTWEVEFDVSCGDHPKCPELAEQLKSERYKMAVGSQLIAHGCEKIMGCCEADSGVDVKAWAEDRNYAGYFPEPGTALPACIHSPQYQEASQQLCDMCKSAVKVKLKPKTDCDTFAKQPKPKTQNAFQNSNVLMPSQLPKHKPFQERCAKVQAMVQSQFGSMQSEFNSKVCECTGCCGGADQELCYYPVNIGMG